MTPGPTLQNVDLCFEHRVFELLETVFKSERDIGNKPKLSAVHEQPSLKHSFLWVLLELPFLGLPFYGFVLANSGRYMVDLESI